MLNYTIVGEGKVVVYLHGFLESSTMWETFDLQKLSFKSILIDLPGHGKSPLNKNYASLAEIACEIKVLLDELDIHEFDIIGHSLGGYIAIELHKLAPANSKLILFHSNFWEDDVHKKKDRNRVIEVVKGNKNLFIQEAISNLFLEQFRKSIFVHALIEEAKLISVDSIISYTELMRDRPSNETYYLSKKKLSLLIHGESDHIIPKELTQQYEDMIQISYTKAGHMGHLEETVVERNLIVSFLN